MGVWILLSYLGPLSTQYLVTTGTHRSDPGMLASPAGSTSFFHGLSTLLKFYVSQGLLQTPPAPSRLFLPLPETLMLTWPQSPAVAPQPQYLRVLWAPLAPVRTNVSKAGGAGGAGTAFLIALLA